MSKITPKDIACYAYCPVLAHKKRYDRVFPKLSLTEECIRRTFMIAELKALMNDNIVAPRKLLRVWEKIWWPAATGAGLSMKEAEQKSVRASYLLSDYCKYDLSDYKYTTLGANVQTQVNIGSSVLTVQADLVKVDLDAKRNTTIVNFWMKNIDNQRAAFDPAIAAIAYAFCTGKNDIVTHIAVNIDEKSDTLKMSQSNFRAEDMNEVKNALFHIERGISKQITYRNPWLCKECNVCPNPNLLTSVNTH